MERQAALLEEEVNASSSNPVEISNPPWFNSIMLAAFINRTNQFYNIIYHLVISGHVASDLLEHFPSTKIFP